MSQPVVKLFAFPLKLKIPNAYWDRLYGEILAQGKIEAHSNDFVKLLLSFHRPQVVHIHWPTILYGSRLALLRPIRLAGCLGILTIAKLRGDKLVWTLHNYRDHESGSRLLEKIAVKFLIKFADSIIVHTQAGQDFLADKHGRTRGVFIIPHGHYIDFHGSALPQPDNRLAAELGISQTDQVFLSLGSIRPYKGLETLIEVFNTLQRWENCRLGCLRSKNNEIVSESSVVFVKSCKV